MQYVINSNNYKFANQHYGEKIIIWFTKPRIVFDLKNIV